MHGSHWLTEILVSLGFIDFFFFLVLIIFPPSYICLNQNLKDETLGAMDQLKEAENEAKALRTMTQRMVLTHEEMVRLDFSMLGGKMGG